MKKRLFTLSFVLLAISCFARPIDPGVPVQKPEIILTSFDNFFSYLHEHVKLSQDLVTYDAQSRPISKSSFLKTLATGNYLPVRLKSVDNKLHYRLYKLSAKAAKEMGFYLKGSAQMAYDHYLMEGMQFPAFAFTDLKGNKYTIANTRGKTLLVNCWFIGCASCEKERPALNQLVKQYAGHKDVVFVSMALDSKAKLAPFLKRKPFNYAVVPDQEKFITNSLKINSYPTHFVVNKDGKIVSVVDTPEDLIYALKNRI